MTEEDRRLIAAHIVAELRERPVSVSFGFWRTIGYLFAGFVVFELILTIWALWVIR